MMLAEMIAKMHMHDEQNKFTTAEYGVQVDKTYLEKTDNGSIVLISEFKVDDEGAMHFNRTVLQR